MRRRTFLFGSAAAAGGLVLGYRAWAASYERAAIGQVQGEGEHLLAGWLKISTDDTVTVYVPHIDMGQGTHTALAMLAAEELDADWSKVRTERAPGERTFANQFLARGWIIEDRKFPLVDGAVDMAFEEIARVIDLQITGGSTAVRMTGRFGMRRVGAAARAMLVTAAATRWSVPAAQISVRDGIVSDQASGRSARFGELAEAAARLPVPHGAPLKQPGEWRIAGTSPGRLDIPAKTDGSFGYGIDLKLPDMLYAALRSAPVHGGRLIDADLAPAKAISGVVDVLRLDNAAAVVAPSWCQARRAVDALELRFSNGDAKVLDGIALHAAQDRALSEIDGTDMVDIGDAVEAFEAAAETRRITATYRVPYLHHAAMEPINITAQFAEGRLTVWGGEQDALGTKAKLVELSGLSGDAVTFHGLAAGGSFGRRIPVSADYLDHIVPLARAASPRPVKLILSREEEFTHGAYRPALATVMKASLGRDGRPTAWLQTFLAGPTRNEGFALPYTIANQSIRAIDFATHVRTGTWRAVAHTQHAYWMESFVDELAHAVGQDSFEYRRSLLPEGSRERKVLETAAKKAGWGEPLPAGHGRGIAIAESYGTVVAEVIEVSLRADGMPHVHRVVAAVDCGTVIHPDTARAQVEGAILMGLGAALFEEITLDGGAVVETNFPNYPIMTMGETPAIEVHFVSSDGAWGGLGEPGLPPAAPALCNALFAAGGRRIRSLPIRRALEETS
ncbi:oxidoreductase subunit beta [Mesorhizobium sp. L-8-10]|uniref:xanthine dehydrogenase family protein molybdopterin-binding subunit n=1 Tax=Mesorhizobium sp. L-8-10 TaxID=2744523 RepID=UPI001927EE5E|nr:molybdopterin cofactor-binding domain-containing protein [Mesorhizobium sp. L-8-10]BCH28400.1 oxidoreductase subunit beta [Mesorhizobium sp. L-8-10]